MVTLKRPGYFTAPRNAEYCGLSTDNKNDKTVMPAENGDEFYEMDTKKVYKFNAESNEWIEQPDDTTAVDTGLPPMSSETAGHFLSNDGSSTHWQTIASSDFIVTLTDNQDGTYESNKTFVEIKTAFDSKENIVVSIGNGDTRLPLMSAEIADNGDAGFTFGYTKVTTDGQLVSTRGVNYYHTADPIADSWTDIDQVGEYLKISGGVLDGNLSMGANNITDVQEIQVNPANPIYIGSVIHAQGTTGVKISATTNGELAVVAPDAQANYKPINVGNPTANTHAVTLGYLTEGLKDEAATKSHVSLYANSGITVGLADGVYLFAACDERHRGLTCVYVCGTTSTVFNLSGMAGWSVEKNSAQANAIYINNTLDMPLMVYITAIGQGSADKFE